MNPAGSLAADLPLWSSQPWEIKGSYSMPKNCRFHILS